MVKDSAGILYKLWGRDFAFPSLVTYSLCFKVSSVYFLENSKTGRCFREHLRDTDLHHRSANKLLVPQLVLISDPLSYLSYPFNSTENCFYYIKRSVNCEQREFIPCENIAHTKFLVLSINKSSKWFYVSFPFYFPTSGNKKKRAPREIFPVSLSIMCPQKKNVFYKI